MKKIILIFLAFLLCSFTQKQTNSFEGIVVDKKTGETLSGVEIKIKETELIVFTDLDGHFIINNVIPGEYSLNVSLVSYNDTTIRNLEIKSDSKFKIELIGK